MPDLNQIPLFVIASLALLVVPGPSVLYVVTRSLNQGRPAGLASVAGIEVAMCLHVAAAALGLSAPLLSSALAFNVVGYLGAAYLIYLGVCKLLSRPDAQAAETIKPEPLWRVFAQGILIDLLNPKTALFFLAFLPQFVQPSRGPVAPQVLTLGALFVCLALVNDGIYALLAGSLGNRLRGNRRIVAGQRWLAGAVYISLGVATVLSVGH